MGPVEAFFTSANGFSAVAGPASFAFKKCQSVPRQAEHVPAFPVRKQVRKQPPLHQPLARLDRHPSIQPPQTAPVDLAAVERLADQGMLAEALSSCERHISLVGPSADAYYLLGVLRDAFGKPDEAVDCYRRAVYLDPNHVDALTHFALHSETQGKTVAAEAITKPRRAVGNQA